MNDLNTLHSAFDELERRADAATASSPFHLPAPRRGVRSRKLAPVAATIAVAGVASGVVLLTENGVDPSGPNSVAVGGATSSAPPPASRRAPERTSSITFPNTAENLAERFRLVLGDTATFEITERIDGEEDNAPVMPLPPAPGEEGSAEQQVEKEPSWAFIKGSLTAFGNSGGFDLQIMPSKKITIAGPSPEKCTQSSVREICIRTLDDGSILTMQEVELQQGGVSYDAKLERADGITILLHLSNLDDPKGPADAEKLSPEPPLTMNQLEEIMISDRW